MKIEIAKPEKMALSGKALLRSIQNQSIPVLDLFVREAVQNSLDAAKPGKKFVKVEMITGIFRKENLLDQLEESSGFKRKFLDSRYEFIAIKDSNTEGLTGSLDFRKADNDDLGNLNKLVYSIGQAQQQSGSGGAWGLGKTVYYRVGCGLVFFYSRIKIKSGYEERLAACFVEDEEKRDTILPSCARGLRKCGVAWWGKKISAYSDNTEPVTNPGEIRDILDIFGIEPYSGTETGTTTIIPFVNKKRVLQDNIVYDSNARYGAWLNSIEDYLRISLQRWYAPRLDNPSYPYGKNIRGGGCCLQAYVNRERIEREDFAPLFKLINKMYRCAVSKSLSAEFKRAGIKKEDIVLRNVLESEKAGTLVYMKVSKDDLDMNAPDYDFGPFLYCNIEEPETNTNSPLVFYVRKPGMIVSYETSSEWCKGIPETDSDHFILGLFVLNSENNLKAEYGISLEDYAKKAERADHNSWDDSPCEKNGKNPGIIHKIKGHVSRKIANAYKEDTVKKNSEKNLSLGNKLGELLLPPEGFGMTTGTIAVKKKSDSNKIPGKKKHAFNLLADETEYTYDGMIMHFKLKMSNDDHNVFCESGIDSEKGYIAYKMWLDEFNSKPAYEIEKIKITDSKGKTVKSYNFDDDVKNEPDEYFSLQQSGGRTYGFKFKKNNENVCEYDIKIHLNLYRRDVNLIFKESWG